jgi:hypothetical protein
MMNSPLFDRDRVSRYDLHELLRTFHTRFVAVVPEASPCPACAQAEGDYTESNAPVLPVRACTNPHGCSCWYLALPPGRAGGWYVRLMPGRGCA